VNKAIYNFLKGKPNNNWIEVRQAQSKRGSRGEFLKDPHWS